jgi:alpha-glucosidase (family GH31 glycosyl hydrolase)
MLNYQDDENTYNLDGEFMIGEDLLVAPIVKPDLTSRLVYLPKGVWYDYWTNKKYSGGTMVRVDAPLETVPMFVRGGAIIPQAQPMNYVGEKPFDPITFAIYPDDNGAAATALYEDDGLSPAYKSGAYRRTTVSVKRATKGSIVSLGAPTGSYNPPPRKFSFAIKSAPNNRAVTIADDGRAQQIEIK